MTSLTKVAIATRKTIRYSIYAVIFIIVARMVILTGIAVYKKLFPPPPPPPTVAFGKLPKIAFPKKDNLPQLNYTVETTDGVLPVLPDQGKVYFMPKLTSNLLALDVAKKKAVGLGFTSEPEAVTGSVYKFTHPRVPATLEMNIITGIFSLGYDLASDPGPLEKRPPTPESATTTAKAFLSNAGYLAGDLTGETSHEFLKVEEQKLVPALSLSEANLVRVSFFRKSLDELPSLPADPTKGNVWLIVTGDQSKDKKIIAGEYRYFPIDEAQASTYPLKSTQQAYEELKSGKGFVANLGQNNNTNVTIRRIYLAYYDPNEPASFYQPIIVFEGDRGFMAYVPAITAEYTNE